jgi:hypothetical protein
MNMTQHVMILVGSLLVSLICASVITPLVLKAINKAVEYFTHKPQDKTYSSKYSVYIPYPIQKLRRFLNLHNRKSGIVKTKCIAYLNTRVGKVKVDNTLNTVRHPLSELDKNPSQDGCHDKRIISRKQPNANKTLVSVLFVFGVCPIYMYIS